MINLIGHCFLHDCLEPSEMLLCLLDEEPELLNLAESLTVHLLARERIEALFKAIERVGLR